MTSADVVLDVENQAVHVHSVGSGAPAYVLVPGLGVSHRYFARLAAELALSGTVHVLQMPDFGRTRAPFGIADLARTAWLALAELRVSDPVLVGHSMGTQIVVEMARTRPAALQAAVLLAPVANPAERSGWRQGLRLGSGILAEPPRANWIVVTDSARCGIAVLARRLRVLLAYPIEDHVAEVKVPIVIIRGQRDPVVPLPWAAELTRRCRHGRLVDVPAAGHIVMFDHPEIVADHCRRAAAAGALWQPVQ